MFSVNAIFVLLLFLLGKIISLSAIPVGNYSYEATRSALFYDEEVLAIGRNLTCIRSECTANEFIMALKNQGINKGTV